MIRNRHDGRVQAQDGLSSQVREALGFSPHAVEEASIERMLERIPGRLRRWFEQDADEILADHRLEMGERLKRANALLRLKDQIPTTRTGDLPN